MSDGGERPKGPDDPAPDRQRPRSVQIRARNAQAQRAADELVPTDPASCVRPGASPRDLDARGAGAARSERGSLKIDLDSLDRVASAAHAEEPNWRPDFTVDGGWACPGGNQVESFIVSADPKTVRSLIARIRELEMAIRDEVDDRCASGEFEYLRPLLEKGAVLP